LSPSIRPPGQSSPGTPWPARKRPPRLSLPHARPPALVGPRIRGPRGATACMAAGDSRRRRGGGCPHPRRNGKPLDDARVEVLGILEHVQYAIENAERVLDAGRSLPVPPCPTSERGSNTSPTESSGVIGPWNFPLLTPGGHPDRGDRGRKRRHPQAQPDHAGIGEWLVRTWQRAVPDLPNVLQCLNGFGPPAERSSRPV